MTADVNLDTFWRRYTASCMRLQVLPCDVNADATWVAPDRAVSLLA